MDISDLTHHSNLGEHPDLILGGPRWKDGMVARAGMSHH